MQRSEIKELIQARQLQEKGKYYEALQVLNSLKENSNLTSQEQISCDLLKSMCLSRLGQDDDALKLAEQVYQESKKWNNRIQLLDASLIIAESLTWLNQEEKALELISNSEDLLFKMTYSSSREYAQRKTDIFYIKGSIHLYKAELDYALELTNQGLKIAEEYSLKQHFARCLYLSGRILAHQGEIDHSLDCLKQALSIEENCLNRNLTRIYTAFGVNFIEKGDLESALKYSKQGLALAEKMNDKRDIAGILTNIGSIYRLKGDLIHANEYLEQSLIIFEKITSVPFQVLDSLFQIALDMDDIEKARKYLQRLKQIKNRGVSKTVDLIYRIDRALMLKKSLRAINRGKAEEILKKIVEEKTLSYESKILVLLNLCDLLLVDLRITSDIEILKELQPFIKQLLDIAEINRTPSLLAETYLLQARLALITVEIKKARRFLTQAQKIAERYDFKMLAKKASKEHDLLLKQLKTWEQLKESGASLTERMKFARIEEQMQGMLSNRMQLIPGIITEKVTVHIERKTCIVCKGDVERFNIYICPECNTIYCQNCARALIDLENICWSCNTPISPSTPIKPYEKGEGIEISSKKDIKTPKK